MTLERETINTLLLYLITGAGAVISAIWLALILWTWRDMRLRSRDPLAQIAASLVVAVLGLFGLIVYIMLRPQETLAEAYERSLEEEALLQNIEEKPVCPGCGRPTKDNWQVCPYCHTRLKKVCPACEALLDLPWNLCPYCATPQVAAPGMAASVPPRYGAPPAPPLVASAPAEPVEYVEGDPYS